MSLCASCYPQLGLSGPLVGSCASARTVERLRCVTSGASTFPAVQVRRSRVGFYAYGGNGLTPPPPGGNLDVAGGLGIPLGCGTPVDDFLHWGQTVLVIYGSNASTVQIQWNSDYGVSFTGPVTFPVLPASFFDSRPAGNWRVAQHVDRLGVLPAGSFANFGFRVTRGPAGPNWTLVDLGHVVYYHYAFT